MLPILIMIRAGRRVVLIHHHTGQPILELSACNESMNLLSGGLINRDEADVKEVFPIWVSSFRYRPRHFGEGFIFLL